MQNGKVLESWLALKLALTQMFDRRVSFTASMQKIEARKWIPSKESFDQYSIDKLALIHRLNLPEADIINLLIGGIPQHSLRATASTLSTISVDQFLEAMRRVIASVGDFERRPPNQGNKNNRSKDSNKDPKGQRDGKATESTCNYCKKRGHWKADCQLLKRKEKSLPTASSLATAKEATTSSQPTAAAVAESASTESAKFKITSPLIKILRINDNSCTLNALMDTGSPVSFVSYNTLKKYSVQYPR